MFYVGLEYVIIDYDTKIALDKLKKKIINI